MGRFIQTGVIDLRSNMDGFFIGIILGTWLGVVVTYCIVKEKER